LYGYDMIFGVFKRGVHGLTRRGEERKRGPRMYRPPSGGDVQ